MAWEAPRLCAKRQLQFDHRNRDPSVMAIQAAAWAEPPMRRGRPGASGFEVGRLSKGRVIPVVFSAAGLMVPDGSIMSLPMPFIDVETGCDAEYMVANYSSSGRHQGCRTDRAGARKRP